MKCKFNPCVTARLMKIKNGRKTPYIPDMTSEFSKKKKSRVGAFLPTFGLHGLQQKYEELYSDHKLRIKIYNIFRNLEITKIVKISKNTKISKWPYEYEKVFY